MNQREKLIELLNEARRKCVGSQRCLDCVGYGNGAECINHLSADYLLENGVIVPPCKVGDRLYQIVEMPKHTFISEFPIIAEPQQIIYKNIIGYDSCIPFDDFGKTVFLTREEAEKALAERSRE